MWRPDGDRGGDSMTADRATARRVLFLRGSLMAMRVTTSSGRRVAASRALKSTPSAEVVAA